MINDKTIVIDALALMEETLHRLAGMIDPPQMTDIYPGRRAPRYAKQGVKQVIVPKMARVVSTSRAAIVLLEASYLIEHAALVRMVEETVEDIMFLARGLELGLQPEHHEYLASFYPEYYKSVRSSGIPDLNERPEFKRWKLRKYIDAMYAGGPVLPDGETVGSLIKRTYAVNSGYVHGNCSQLMELYGANPPGYHVSGVPHPSAPAAFAKYLRHSIEMAVVSFAAAANGFGDHESAGRIVRFAVRQGIVSAQSAAGAPRGQEPTAD
ncbi:hypothetical protein OKW45_002717 [Paraburkholderia sp. WSM4175]|uniref:hypothetical protein n=1 Tax=Paraburkholderia sp. WSM4175 TaxID=2991072 RepID=UPI003D1D3C7B